MIDDYKYISPFNISISFHKLVENLEEIALSEVEYRSLYAKGLLDQIKHKPELISGIESLEIIKNNEELIHHLLADLFPTALTNNEIKAVTLPFHDLTFNYSERFKKILNEVGMSFDMTIRDLDEHQFYIMNCTLILNAYFGQNVDFGKPLFYDIPDKNGIVKHYRILYNGDFLEISPSENTVYLNQTEIDELIDNYDNIDLWKEKFPENSWNLKGFAIISLIDVTIESAVSTLKSNLLKIDSEKSKLNKSFESLFRSVFKIPDLKIGLVFYDEEKSVFVTPPYNTGDLKSFLLMNVQQGNAENIICGHSYESLLRNNKPIIIPDVSEFGKIEQNTFFAEHLLNQNLKSFMFVPVIKDDKLLGLFELASSTIRSLNSVNANKLELILPYITDSIEKTNIDMANQLEAIIQKEYTAIHPSVYWKFRAEAKNYFYSSLFMQNYTFKEIVFKDVYPLYGQIDIKGSSDNRNAAIIKDLKEQINHIIDILETLYATKKIAVIEQKKFELKNFIKEIENGFVNNLEQIIHHYIETEIHSFLKNTAANIKSEDLINAYFQKLDVKSGMFYETRKDFDDTIMSINKNLAAILDEKQLQAQEIFPHYYERFKTDGVEHNLYIGASISPDLSYNPMYMNNLRLWQLETLCEMELEHHQLKATLPYTLDVTSLILVFSSPISIRFRMDEKRFDVDGSYNASYEVVKKRIDKAFIKNSTERITQKEKITIVYSNSAEEKEYLKYIKYLQHKNVLEEEIEKLEVEDLQGVSGLKALRVKVRHNDNTILIEANRFITDLFKERLDCKYSYHNLEHTKNVVLAIETLCEQENTDPKMTEILLLAGWFHDAGYVEDDKNHEQKSVQIASEFLKMQNVADEVLQKVSDLILATTFNYSPKNLFENIIKDADNVHLADINYPNVLGNLRDEWATCSDQNYCDIDWYHLNVDFLKNHQYYTKFAQENWQILKEENLKLIEQKLLNQA